MANGAYDLAPTQTSYWTYKPSQVFEYDDSFWQMYVIDYFFPSFASGSYYSEVSIFNYWILGNWSW